MPECDGARERSGLTGRLPAPRSQKQPDDQTSEVETREREPRQTPGENTQGKTGKKAIRTQSMERTGRPNPQKFPQGTAPLDPTVTHRQIQRSKKSQLSDRDSAEATDLKRNRVMRHIRPGERKRSPVADPSDDPLTRKRDEWKARTRTEGNSKAPSTSIASSTCRKAGARGKHIRNVGTTPGSVRGEEKSLEQAPTNSPEERMSPQDSASNARYR